jgi:isoleucyl-tRNA synthetase
MAERIYQNLVVGKINSVPASVHHVPFPQASDDLIDDSLSAHVAASIKLVSLGRSARKASRLKVRQPLAELIVAPGNEAEAQAVEMFRDHLLEELNVKQVTVRDCADDMVTTIVEPDMRKIGPKFGRNAATAKASPVTSFATCRTFANRPDSTSPTE